MPNQVITPPSFFQHLRNPHAVALEMYGKTQDITVNERDM